MSQMFTVQQNCTDSFKSEEAFQKIKYLFAVYLDGTLP
jgi:hypothetical protein